VDARALPTSFSVNDPDPLPASTLPSTPSMRCAPEPVFARTLDGAGTVTVKLIDTPSPSSLSISRPMRTTLPVCSIGGLASIRLTRSSRLREPRRFTPQPS
jgi:hypothetical protein